MTGIHLIAALVSMLLSGGLIGVLANYLINRRKLTNEERSKKREDDREDFQLVLALVTRQRDEAYKEVRELRDRFELLELELQGMRLAGDIDPFPHWIVDLDGRYIFVNREFEKQFLEPRGMIYRDMIGKHHEDLWPDAFCRKLKQLDAQARSRPDGRARATTVVENRQVTVHKFPVRLKGVPVAFAGYITDIEDVGSAAKASPDK
jgi:PAS domain S-box-containing protein